MSETTIAAIAISVGFIAQIVLQVMAKMEANRIAKQLRADTDAVATRAKIAAIKVEDVRNTLVVTTDITTEKLDKLAKVTDDVHTLVNSNMGVQLRLNAELSRWKADNSKGDKLAEDAAIEAEKAYRDHMAKQHEVDSLKRRDEDLGGSVKGRI